MGRSWRRSVLTGVGLVGMTSCDAVFGFDLPTPDAGGDAYDGVPTLAVPTLFPDDAPDATLPYLFEGTGFATAPGAHQPVPIVIDGVGASDSVTLEIPIELGVGWEVCGQTTAPGPLALDLAQLAPPCRHAGRLLALTITVPVSAPAGAATPVSPLVIRIDRGDAVHVLPITMFALDELEGFPTPVSGLYSTIQLASLTPSKAGPGISWRAVSDVQLDGAIDVRGAAGQTHDTANACGTSGAGCAGGVAGPGNPSNGATSCGDFNTAICSASAPLGGTGGARCNTGGFCAFTAASSGGGGGYVSTGFAGTSSVSNACTNAPGGSGGAADADPFLLLPIGGGGGGAGAMVIHSAAPGFAGGGGGGGGGVITIDTLGTLQLGAAGQLLARGGDGGVGIITTCNGSSQLRAGVGGAGAGGAIRLRARRIVAPVDLDTVLDVRGGNAAQVAADDGHGSPGRLRVDGVGADDLDTTRPGVVRGPDHDEPPPIVDTEMIAISARGRSADEGVVHWGVRAAGAEAYVIQPALSGGGVVSLPVPLALGLNEVCVFTGPQVDTRHDQIPAAAKRCSWVARVPSP